MKKLMAVAAVAFAVLSGLSTRVQGLSLKELTGVWLYESYAEIETPDKKLPVGARMDFRPDGTVAMTLSTGSAEGTYRMEGDTIHYADANGEQVWKIHSYEPGKSLVVEHRRALLFFVRIVAD